MPRATYVVPPLAYFVVIGLHLAGLAFAVL